MAERPSRRDVIGAILIVLLTGVLLSQTIGAGATHQPANKVAASATIDEMAFVANGETDELLSETFKTSKPMDLLLQASAECSIITNVVTVGNDSDGAEGQLRFLLTISTNGGAERPIGVTQQSTGNSVPGTPQETGDDGSVVFCDQLYSRTITKLGDNADNDDARMETFLKTRHAAGFNWAHLNTGAGIHTVKLYAEYEEAEGENSTAEGAVGRRTLIIEPVKMKNDEQVTALSD
jgi:hypothetical protein